MIIDNIDNQPKKIKAYTIYAHPTILDDEYQKLLLNPHLDENIKQEKLDLIQEIKNKRNYNDDYLNEFENLKLYINESMLDFKYYLYQKK